MENLHRSKYNSAISFPQHPKIEQNGESILNKVEKETKTKIKEVPDNQLIETEEIQALKNEMEALGLNKKNVYWFIQGHHIVAKIENDIENYKSLFD